MQLADAAQRLLLDLDAVAISTCLAERGVPHALIKGPSTSTWLYDPPRPYNDVDLLVPRSAVKRAVAALEAGGIAHRTGTRVGEEAHHSLAMLTSAGYQLDLHVSLPCVPVRGDLVWDTLAPHVVPLDLRIGTLPALDEAGRCLVLALHALGTDGRLLQKVEDLRRADTVAPASSWATARQRARAMGAEDLYDGGRARLAATPGPMSHRASLYFNDAPASALALQRLRDARWWERPAMVLRETFPSPGFMRDFGGIQAPTAWGFLRGYLARLVSLARSLMPSRTG